MNDIFKKVFASLHFEDSKTITQISEFTKIPNITVKKYLELIEFIQAQPKLVLERTGHSYQAKLQK